jgi:hypothetical protein
MHFRSLFMSVVVHAVILCVLSWMWFFVVYRRAIGSAMKETVLMIRAGYGNADRGFVLDMALLIRRSSRI